MGNSWNVGGTTLGLELPADEIGTFTEIIIGEQYKFAVGNFSTAPSSASYIYATIANGRLVAATSLADGVGVAFKILRSEGFTLGARYGFDGYILEAIRTPETLGSLSGVTLTTPSSGQVLKYDGSKWANAADAT